MVLPGQKSQRELFEEAWGKHIDGDHPNALALHVERRADDAQKLTFRQMCGESSFIPPSQLHKMRNIGSGSFASVEICKYKPPGGPEQTVAVKRLTSHATVDVADFASEANILRQLKHESIVRYIGAGSSEEDNLVKHHDKSSCYLVQEYMDSGTLKQKLWSQAGLMKHVYSDHDAVQWSKNIADGLAYLHSANPVVLHRDLKLENILLEKLASDSHHPAYRAKICDFGLAVSLLDPNFDFRPNPMPSGLARTQTDDTFHDQMRSHVSGDSSSLHPQLQAKSQRFDEKLQKLSVKPSFKRGKSMTRGTPVPQPQGSGVKHEAYALTGRAGSFLYMAPEVVMSEPYDEKADVFSLAVITFELFLRKPLSAVMMELDNGNPGVSEMFAYKIAGGYRHPMPGDWPAELRQLISDGWQQDPEKRPTAAEMASRLGKLEDGELFRKWEEQHTSQMAKCCSIQ